MFSQLTLWLSPLFGLMSSGALALLGIVLWRGELCAGQHSRISQHLASVWIFAALALLLAGSRDAAIGLLVSGALAVFGGLALSVMQSRLEGKRSLPSLWWWAPGLPLAVFALQLATLQGWGLALSQALLLGAVLAHLILLRARHRLQAFNLLLPLLGLLGAMLGLLWLAVLTLRAADTAHLATLAPWVIGYCLVLLVGLLTWFSPLLLRRDSAPVVASSSMVLLLLSQCMASWLFGLI
jgi:hypothetical protein